MTASMTFLFSGRCLSVLLVGAFATGCGSLSSGLNSHTFKPYVPEVVQGNFVSNEQLKALQPGIPRALVRDILGTPLVASLFHADRWDYAFSIQRQGVEPQNLRLTVHFSGDALVRVDADVLPSEAEFAGRLVRPKVQGKLPLLQANPEDLKNFAPAQAPAQIQITPLSEMRQYPPLESSVR